MSTAIPLAINAIAHIPSGINALSKFAFCSSGAFAFYKISQFTEGKTELSASINKYYTEKHKVMNNNPSKMEYRNEKKGLVTNLHKLSIGLLDEMNKQQKPT
jgi:hypothetical protein